MRLFLALKCFWRVLLGRPLPAEVLALPAPAAAPEPAKPDTAALERGAFERGAVATLAVLQRDGRLVDFILEDIETYKDDQVGAAVRDVHRNCRKTLREHFEFAPVRAEREGSRVEVEPGFDAGAVRLTGNVSGEPPFSGTLRHPGWRVSKIEVAPVLSDGVVAPAEVEL